MEEEKIVERYCQEQCDVESNWHDRDCPHEGEVALLEQEIKQLTAEKILLQHVVNQAVEIIREGKRKFAPNTTNSLVDDFLERYGQ